ncbi:hypothetical protein [Ruegeria aquimaris]|uniref:Lipoprotein n=1 Tax=Ruegeria aquimaris TaxID=2984333 RepID=A0ABT3AQT0_9RHOB|nr:hypothetical protein [Ruegeria sp. XHP0148]MCV2891044.1 hypothetical protein [Ruegeria sp. XHP0148]
MLRFCLISLVLITACTQVPELDEHIGPELQGKPFPKLVSLDQTLGPPADPEDEAQKLAESLDGRRAALQAKAQRLRQAVPDEGEDTE